MQREYSYMSCVPFNLSVLSAPMNVSVLIGLDYYYELTLLVLKKGFLGFKGPETGVSGAECGQLYKSHTMK